MTSPVSFNALRTFVEVGRQGSIKRAARELNVTSGAVSQQIRALETRLGVNLLERENRVVRLSAYGLRLFGAVAPGFEQIDEAVQGFMDRRSGPRSLVVSTTPALAASWLTPRLGSFSARHPEIGIRIETSVELADLKNGAVDIAVRHGSGMYAGPDAASLFSPQLVVIASPSTCGDFPLKDPADCLRYPLLQDRDRIDWPAWFKANRVKPGRNAVQGPSYADDALLIQGVIAGQGLAVVRDIYAAGALKTGHIMLAADAAVPTEERYFVVTDPKKLADPKIAAFRSWIMQEAGIV